MSAISVIYKGVTDNIKQQMKSRAVRGSNELRNAAMLVLRGKGSGRVYRVPGTKAMYTASAPGEVPANRTEMYRMAWNPRAFDSSPDGEDAFSSAIENDIEVGSKKKYLLGELLEGGTKKMAPRPHHDKIKEKALPDIMRIYEESYF